MYLYKIAVKNPVKNMKSMKMLNKPKIKENNSAFDLVFKLNPTIIGKVGIIQGDNIEITPVKNEISGIISILKTSTYINYH